MKTLGSIITSTVAVGLLAASAAGVSASGDREIDPGVASVTGTMVALDGGSPGTTESAGPVIRTSDVVRRSRWTTNDARLNGDVTYTGNWYDVFGPAGDGISASSATYELVNEDGSWFGTATGFVSALPEDGKDTIMFTGLGAYDGLSAYVVVDYYDEGAEIAGIIFPGTMPSAPMVAVGER